MAAYFSQAFPSLPEFSPYIAIFLLLTAGIWLIPFAEEIALAAAGYLYYSDKVQLVTVLSVAAGGVFLGDFLVFWLGRRWGSAWLQRSLTFPGSRQWLDMLRGFLDRHGARTLFWARFLPGARLPTHVLVGAHGMSVGTYTRTSLLSVAFYVPAVFALACSFGDKIGAALNLLKSLGDVTWGTLLLTVILWSVIRFWASRVAPASRRRTAL